MSKETIECDKWYKEFENKYLDFITTSEDYDLLKLAFKVAYQEGKIKVMKDIQEEQVSKLTENLK